MDHGARDLPRARWRQLGAVATAILLTSSCGSGGSSPEPGVSSAARQQATETQSQGRPVDAVLAAAETTTREATANIAIEVETQAAGQTISVSGTGQMDAAHDAVAIDLETTVPGQEPLHVSQVVVDDTIYIKGLPEVPAEQWVQVSLEELGAAPTTSPAVGTDPARQLQLLRQVSDDVREEGTEEINGVTATKYTGTVDLQKAADAAAEQNPDAAKALQRQYEALGVSRVPFEVFIDDEGRPVRVVTTIEGTVNGEAVEVMSRMDFTDWGTDVSIEAPADAVPLADVAPTPTG